MTRIRTFALLAALAWLTAIICIAPLALAHPGHVVTEAHPLPADAVPPVHAPACRPVRHGDTTGVHVGVVR